MALNLKAILTIVSALHWITVILADDTLVVPDVAGIDEDSSTRSKRQSAGEWSGKHDLKL